MCVCVHACVHVCVCFILYGFVPQQLDKSGTSPEATANTTERDKEKDLKTCEEDVSGEYSSIVNVYRPH